MDGFGRINSTQIFEAFLLNKIHFTILSSADQEQDAILAHRGVFFVALLQGENLKNKSKHAEHPQENMISR